jgi:hypothetical protein
MNPLFDITAIDKEGEGIRFLVSNPIACRGTGFVQVLLRVVEVLPARTLPATPMTISRLVL